MPVRQYADMTDDERDENADAEDAYHELENVAKENDDYYAYEAPADTAGAREKDGYYDLESYSEESVRDDGGFHHSEGETPEFLNRDRHTSRTGRSETARAALKEIRRAVKGEEKEDEPRRFPRNRFASEEIDVNDGEDEIQETVLSEAEDYDPDEEADYLNDDTPDIREMDKVNMMRRSQKASLTQNIKDGSGAFFGKLRGLFSGLPKRGEKDKKTGTRGEA